LKILALDTSTVACSAALWIDGEVNEQFQIAPRQHSDLILPMVDQLLADAQMTLQQLDAIAFARGPGSFTGLRIAAGVTQGLAFGADLPVIPVSTLAALAQGVYREQGAEQVMVANDAGMSEVYAACYGYQPEQGMCLLGGEQVCRPEQFVAPGQGCWVGAGSGWADYRELLVQRMRGRLSEIVANIYPHARDVATLAANSGHRNTMVSAEQAIPVYLRDNVVGN